MVKPVILETIPTDVPADDAIVLEVVTRNNRACVVEIEKLKALQAWAKLPLQDGGK